MINTKIKVIIWAGGSIIALLAVLVYVLGWAGVEGTIFKQESINYFGKYTWNYTTIDVFKYLKSLETSLSLDQFKALNINTPQLPNTPTNSDALAWISYIAKILAVFIPNILIMIINVIMTPIKLMLYPAKIFAALVGCDTTNNGIIQFANAVYSFNIQFIPYW